MKTLPDIWSVNSHRALLLDLRDKPYGPPQASADRNCV